ncbi:hypothetical protein EWM64_g7204 [Hericium alpestre]|uniref:Uncharacterized protein n=1 Tax=Hericium alpestre TaxID=135208 RepID=A0A4Y9ZTI8_9AGAM|nr:hypothetical protein EWM64_g7204 [Hericium alpestre]
MNWRVTPLYVLLDGMRCHPRMPPHASTLHVRTRPLVPDRARLTSILQADDTNSINVK